MKSSPPENISSPSRAFAKAKSDRLWKHLLVAFSLAAVLYLVSFAGIEYRRTRKGPWRVDFTNGPSGEPALVINQVWLGLTNVQLLFPGESLGTNAGHSMVFSQPQKVPYGVPFGQCIFMDTTFLPGTVTFQLFGHEIELLPRVLMVDHEEHPWPSNASLTVSR